jgi:hypothetical protein
LTFVDWDNDGDLDFARHTSSTFGIHSNDGLGAFSASSAASSNTRATILSAGDFDNDGDPDVIVAGTTTAGAPSIRVYQNPRISPPLPAPAGLTATVEGDSVLLSWPEATNPGGHPLSYNLRVGSRPGAADVLSPMADTLTGVPLLPQAGNAGAVNFHRLRGLRPGTYYWSVQTLDAAWNGFPFASETNFVITTPPLPPRFTGVSVLGGSQLRVTISARPGSTVLIERSEDLVSWSSIGTYQIDAFGALTWTGTRSGTTAFFRFREAP